MNVTKLNEMNEQTLRKLGPLTNPSTPVAQQLASIVSLMHGLN